MALGELMDYGLIGSSDQFLLKDCKLSHDAVLNAPDGSFDRFQFNYLIKILSVSRLS